MTERFYTPSRIRRLLVDLPDIYSSNRGSDTEPRTSNNPEPDAWWVRRLVVKVDIEQALDSLPESTRAIVYRLHVLGFTLAEVADELGTDDAAVYWQAEQGVQDMARFLGWQPNQTDEIDRIIRYPRRNQAA